MKALLPFLAILTLFPTAVRDQFAPDPPGPIVVGKKGVVTAGDTLAYTISWGPGARATSYNVTTSVVGTNGTWAVVADSNGSGKWPPLMPAVGTNGVGAFPQTATVTFTLLKTWLAAAPWDSATFTVTVASKNAIGVSTPVSATWKVARRPGPPGPITVDSSLIVIGTLVLPTPNTLALGASRVLCAFKQFGNGAVAQWTADRTSCDSIYVKYVPAPARASVTAWQQAHTDSIARTCVTWSTLSSAVQLTPSASCSAAARVTGLGLTRRFPADATRYGRRAAPAGITVAWRDSP